jgi:hypothetical protein
VTTCGQMRSELGGYVLGGLTPDEHRAVDAHLLVCEPCRSEAEELAVVPGLLATLRATPRRAPADLRQRVLGRPARRRGRVAPALAAAAIVLAALSGATVARVVDRPPPPDAVLSFSGAEPAGIVGEADLRQLPTGVQVDLELAGMQPPEEGYYHAWLLRGERRVSAGTFVGTADGTAAVQLLCGGELADYDRLNVTWHPFGEPDEVVALDAAIDR